MAVNTKWYCNFGNGSSTGYYAVTAWATGTVKAAGALVRQNATPTVGNERVFVCIVAGTTHATTEPTWTVTKGAKNTDNTVTWQECTGQPAVNGDLTNTPLSSAVRSTSPGLGQIIQNNAGTFYFICSTAGACGAGEPTYNTTAGATTADNTATWTCIGAVGGFALWNAPHARIPNAVATNWAATAGGDTVYVSSAHAETTGAAWSIGAGNATSNPTTIICVANAGSSPPVSADVTTGASASTTGNFALTLGFALDIWGIAFNCGTGAVGPILNLGSSNSANIRLRNCALNITCTGVGQLNIGSSAQTSWVTLENTPISFGGSASQSITLGSCHFTWRDTPAALSLNTGASYPTTLFNGTPERGATALIENCDLSNFPNALTGGTCGSQRIVVSRCKLHATLAGFSNGSQLNGAARVDFINCDTAGATYRHERWWYEGTQTTDITAVRSGGASDGTTPYSWKIITNGSNSALWRSPFECMPVPIWNATTGSNVVATVECAYVGAAIPNNDDIWLSVRYLGTAASTLGSVKTTEKINPVVAAGAAGSASSALWGASAAARANTTAYVVGDEIGVSSASSIVRLFVCTTAGTSSGSLPGGYATAVDGSSITDGSAVFRAVCRFTLAVTLTSPAPQAAGYLYGSVNVGRGSARMFVDPVMALS